MLEKILAISVGFLEETPSETERVSLEVLCQAAMDRWMLRLLPGILSADCRAFVPAAAFTGLAAFLSARGASAPLAAVTAGDVSLRYEAGKDMAVRLQEQAEALMAPYVQESGFAFRGVRG